MWIPDTKYIEVTLNFGGDCIRIVCLISISKGMFKVIIREYCGLPWKEIGCPFLQLPIFVTQFLNPG